jgi:hypothetical protein
MVRRLAVLMGVLVLVTGLAGCYTGSRALGSVSGCNSVTLGSPVCTYARAWSRNMWHQQQFIDQYFLNYDVNDPYRCDCPIYDYCPCGTGYCGQASVCPPYTRSGS